jgi:NADH:ubiquinone oxidoreductase subunit 6 (subunit J)
MTLILNLYFVISIGIVISSSFVVFVSNPIYSLLWLVLSFLFSASLLLLLGCEFLALIFIVVYVGAIAVLFLFVVMLLDLKFKNLKNKKTQTFTAVLVLGSCFLFFLLFFNFTSLKQDTLVLDAGFINKKASVKTNYLILYFPCIVDKISLVFINWRELTNSVNDIQLYSFILYDTFVLQFLLVGFVLLAVLIEVVYLTNSYKNLSTYDQSIFKQISVNSNFFTAK